ncbi:MAG: arylsulfatase A-like enzyme [Mariniblastus sp.]|jgi:arylsulfatase A-like enzyme
MLRFLMLIGLICFAFPRISVAHKVDLRKATGDRPPNIIFIMADDLGYGDLGCYGGKAIATPNLDRIASEGMRFTNCYAGSTVCAPSRSVLMTGLHTGHTRVRGNVGMGGVRGLGGREGRIPLQDADVTVAEVLKSAGYVTGITGKWGLGEPKTAGIPQNQGFDEWFGYLNQRQAHNHYPDFIWLGKERFPLVGNVDGKQQQYSHDLFTGFALNFIRKHQQKPFFLYLPYCVPHDRFQVPELGAYADEPWAEQEKIYAAMVSRLDDHVGRIMKLLIELKIDDETIVFFCSDNGAANRYDGVLDSSGPLRGHKRDMYEGGLRTPMVVRWPSQIAAGASSDVAWSFADFLPTAAAMAKANVPEKLDGTSVLPTMLGQSQDFGDRFLYWEFFERGFQQAVRWKQWKAIRGAPGSPLELYDLNADVGESIDVSAKYPAIVSSIESFLLIARTESKEFPTTKD